MPEAMLSRRSEATVSATTAGILGLGAALPDTVVSTETIAGRLGVEPGWILSRTGIAERRHASDHESLTSLATAAARDALADAGLRAADLDAVLVATISADDLLPAAAALVAGELGCAAALTVDVNAACTGFLAALDLATAAVEADRARHVLVVGAEVLSRLTDHDDRRTAALFGDGAGAVVVGAGSGAIGPLRFGAEAHRDLLFAGRERGVIEMNGAEVFRHAVTRMTEATRSAADDLDAIDLFVYHQANQRILRAVATRLGLSPDRVVDAIPAHGNTSAASIPLALHTARADGRLEPGMRVLLCAFGAGFAWGAGVISW